MSLVVCVCHLSLVYVISCMPLVVSYYISIVMDVINLSGTYSTYMEKEIFEQPNSTERTLKGRVDFDNYKGMSLIKA